MGGPRDAWERERRPLWSRSSDGCECAGDPALLQGSRGLGVVTERLGCVWLSLTSSRGGWDQPTSASPCHFSCSLAVEFVHLLGISLLTLGVGGCHLVGDGRAGGLRLLSLSLLWHCGARVREAAAQNPTERNWVPSSLVPSGCASVLSYLLEAHAILPSLRTPMIGKYA